MRTLWTLAIKDLLVASRDLLGLFWMLLFPLLLALFFGSLFGGGGSGGMNKLRLAVIDEDGTADSKAFLARLEKSKALEVSKPTKDEARELVRRGKQAAYLVLPKGMGEPAARWRGGATMTLGLDPSRSAEGSYLEGVLAQEYFAGFAEDFTNPAKLRGQIKEWQKDLPAAEQPLLLGLFGSLDTFMEQLDKLPKGEGPDGGGLAFTLPIQREEVGRVRTGPRSAFEVTFPSSMLWAIIGCVTTFACSLVNERTGGTWLRLSVAPLSRGQLLAGKGLACFLASIAVALVLLGIGVVVLGVRVDDPVMLAVVLACTAFCFTGLMMLLSTLGQTPAAVSGFSTGVLMPLAMIGGGMVPLMVMPPWLLSLSDFSPVKWGIYGLEGAIWRGFGWVEVLLPCGILLAVGAVCYVLGVRILSRRAV